MVGRRQEESGNPVFKLLEEFAPRRADHAAQECTILGAPFQRRGGGLGASALGEERREGEDAPPEEVAVDTLASVASRALRWWRAVVGVFDKIGAVAAALISLGRAGRAWRRRPPAPLARLGGGA